MMDIIKKNNIKTEKTRSIPFPEHHNKDCKLSEKIINTNFSLAMTVSTISKEIIKNAIMLINQYISSFI